MRQVTPLAWETRQWGSERGAEPDVRACLLKEPAPGAAQAGGRTVGDQQRNEETHDGEHICTRLAGAERTPATGFVARKRHQIQQNVSLRCSHMLDNSHNKILQLFSNAKIISIELAFVSLYIAIFRRSLRKFVEVVRQAVVRRQRGMQAGSYECRHFRLAPDTLKGTFCVKGTRAAKNRLRRAWAAVPWGQVRLPRAADGVPGPPRRARQPARRSRREDGAMGGQGAAARRRGGAGRAKAAQPAVKTTLRLLAGISITGPLARPRAAASACTSSRLRTPKDGSRCFSHWSNAALLGAVCSPRRR